MFERFRNMILTPRVWLSAGVFCFGASIVIGYHQDQMAAEEVLAEKVSLPTQVLIQDFDRSAHSNILNEARLIMEAALTETITLNIGSVEEASWVQVTPVYAVGATSKPFLAKYLADSREVERRPMPRDRQEELAAEASNLRPMEKEPMGLVLIDARTPVAQSGLLNSLGDGLNGPLVAITGALLQGEWISQQIVAALAENGISAMKDIPILVPYPDGHRLAATNADYSGIRNTLEWVSLAMILMGVAQIFNLFQRPEKPVAAAFQEVQAVGAFPGVFQPIRTQEELIWEEQERSENESSARRRKLTRMMHPST